MALKKLKHDLNAAIEFAEKSRIDFRQLTALQSVQRLKELATTNTLGNRDKAAICGGVSCSNSLHKNGTSDQGNLLDPQKIVSSRCYDEPSSVSKNGQQETEQTSDSVTNNSPRNCAVQENFEASKFGGRSENSRRLRHKGVISLVCVAIVAAAVTLTSARRAHPLEIIGDWIGAEHREEVLVKY
jgi:hypothetical protein